MKSGSVTINSAEQFFDAANRFVPTITTLFQKEEDVLAEPDDINRAPSIRATLEQLLPMVPRCLHSISFQTGKNLVSHRLTRNSTKHAVTLKENSLDLLCLNRHVHIAMNSIWVKKNLQIG